MTTLYSIGYGNRQWPDVRRLLLDRDCKFLIDVRSRPFSKFNPSFSKESLPSLCLDAGIRYVFMGDTLGGKPTSDEHFDDDGKVDYLLLAQSDEFKVGLNRLLTAYDKGIKVCIMCSELKPHECHRCKLIGARLKDKGIEVVHIDERGIDISQEEALRRITRGQDDMFGNSALINRSRGTYKI